MRQITMEETGGTDVLQMETVPDPSPEPSEILVETQSLGINYAEIETRKGVYPGEVWEPPRVPGMEAAGEVIAVGTAVEEYEEGDRVGVVALQEGGLYREQLCIDPEKLFVPKLPDGMSYDDAVALLIAYLTAFGVLHEHAELTAEDTVLIHAAAGGVGTAGVQLASATGATTVGTASTEEKLAFAASNGLDYPIQYTEEDIAESITEQTGGVSVIMDAVGGSAFTDSIEVLEPYGTCVSYGVASGRPGLVRTSQLLHDNYTLKGFHLRNALHHPDSPVDGSAMFSELCSLYQAGEIEPHIDARFSIDEVAAAQTYVEDRSSRGKVVVHF